MRLNVGRRGLWRLAPSRLRLRDALGIFERSMLAGQPEQVLILPAPDPAMPIPARPASCAAPGEADLDGLEPYVPGSPIGRIHWPALARGAGLPERAPGTRCSAEPFSESRRWAPWWFWWPRDACRLVKAVRCWPCGFRLRYWPPECRPTDYSPTHGPVCWRG